MHMISAFETGSLLDVKETIAAPLFKSFEYPWQVLGGINGFILALGPKLDPERYEQTGPDIWIAKTASVAPTACLIGPLVVCEDAEIRHGAFIRGNAVIGARSVVGNSCEIKNSILFNDVQVPHFNYVGDSILGHRAHLGAGAITSNIKSDRTPVHLRFGELNIETGLRKLGAILGDHVEIGCNSVMNPGAVIGRRCSVYPLTRIRGYIPPDSIVKGQDDIVRRRSEDDENT